MTALIDMCAVTTLADLDRLTANIADRETRIIIGRRLPDGKIETYPMVEVPSEAEGYDPSTGPGLVLLGCDE